MERRGLNEMRPSAHFRPLWAKENRKYFINERFPIYHDGKIIGYDEKRAGTTDDAPQELKDLFAEWQKVYKAYREGTL